jgi:hypothetical protein
MDTKKTWVTPEIYTEDLNDTKDPLKDPGSSELASEQMS